MLRQRKHFSAKVIVALCVVLYGLQGHNALGATLQVRSDDPSEVMTLVQQQGALLQSLQADLTAQKALVSSLQHRLDATTKAVAFTVRLGHDGGQQVGVNIGDHSTVIFDQAITNTGGAYDTQTGFFTAPVSGTYVFFLTQTSADGPDYHELWLDLVKQGSVMESVYSEGSGDTHDQGSTQVTTHMTAGQKVWVRQHVGHGVRGGAFTVFTGYLLQAD